MSDKPSLLSLPVEIRLQIYSCLDHDDTPIVYPLSELSGSQASYLLTCRQLRYEVHHDFFSNNVFAIGFKSDMRMGFTEHPFFKALHAMAGKFGRIDDLQLPTSHVPKTGFLAAASRPLPCLVDTTLVSDGQQESTDMRAFDSFSNDLKLIENLQIHVLHAGSLLIVPWTLPDTLPKYIGDCKEQLNVVLEALVVLKNVKGPLGLTKLTVVDNVPYKRQEEGACGTGLVNSEWRIERAFTDTYWPLLTQAAAILGLSIENVKVVFNSFPEGDSPMPPFELPARALPKLREEKTLKRKHEGESPLSKRGRRYPTASARDSCEFPNSLGSCCRANC